MVWMKVEVRWWFNLNVLGIFGVARLFGYGF
jgi:hypothetical protein